jgi:hypothetical protein
MTELPITWISTIFVCNFTNWGTRLSRQLCSYFCVCIRCLTEHFLNFNIRFQLSNYNCWTMFVLSLNYVCLVAELCLSCRWTMFVLSLNYVCLVSELCLSCRWTMFVLSLNYVYLVAELCLSCRWTMFVLSLNYVCLVELLNYVCLVANYLFDFLTLIFNSISRILSP